MNKMTNKNIIKKYNCSNCNSIQSIQCLDPENTRTTIWICVQCNKVYSKQDIKMGLT